MKQTNMHVFVFRSKKQIGRFYIKLILPSESKQNVPVKLPSASAGETKLKCTNAPRVKISAQTADQCFSMLTSCTQECTPVWTNIPVHNLQAEQPSQRMLGPCACSVTFPSSFLMGSESRHAFPNQLLLIEFV